MDKCKLTIRIIYCCSAVMSNSERNSRHLGLVISLPGNASLGVTVVNSRRLIHVLQFRLANANLQAEARRFHWDPAIPRSRFEPVAAERAPVDSST
jgi:hypothetical protein